jgi:hypothetical protein
MPRDREGVLDVTIPAQPSPPTFLIEVTPLQLFEKLTEIDTKLGVQISQQTGLRDVVDDHESRLRLIEEVGAGKRLDDHSMRLRVLEAWRYALPTSVVMAFGALGVELIRIFAH